MKFFIDTANLAQIKEAHDLGILDGVTTNPSLMAKEGIKGNQLIRDLIDITEVYSFQELSRNCGTCHFGCRRRCV